MSTIRITAVFFLLTIGLFFILSCSSNQPEINTEEGLAEDTKGQDQSEIDELFGIINESEKKQDKSAGDDEVLQLLGIPKQQSEQAGVQETGQEGSNQLKTEIESLEKKLSDKDSEIANLKSEVAEKDQEIGKMESNVPTTNVAEAKAIDMTGNYSEDYQAALQEYYNRHYKKAIQMFEELLAINSSHSLSDNCRYWIGEAYYGLGNYNQAVIEFTKVFSFSNANKMDAAQLKIGLCFMKLGDRARAAQEFERLISDYPNSEFIPKAQEYLSQLP